MKLIRLTIDPAMLGASAAGRIDPARVDATNDKDIALQQAADEREAMQDAAKFARREKLGKIGVRLQFFNITLAISTTEPFLGVRRFFCAGQVKTTPLAS